MCSKDKIAGIDDLKGSRVLIMGLGRFGGGLDSAIFARRAGARVTITDLAPAEKLTASLEDLKDHKDITLHLGGHKKTDFARADVVIVNPAVPPENEFLHIARQNGCIITTQINIFLSLTNATIVGITGANGKSTTTALTAHLLKAGQKQADTTYRKAWLGGNIGTEPLLTLLDKINDADIVVLELSSFQTEMLCQIEKAPRLAVLTNITPNHLDRHKTFEEYCRAKEQLFKYQKAGTNCPAISIFNSQDKIARTWFEKYKSSPGRKCRLFSGENISPQIARVFPLPGQVNLSNLAAAMCVAEHFGVSEKTIIQALPNFKPLRHRLELVTEAKGVRWYNDSISTTPQSTIAAIDAFTEPKVLIAGGYDKNLSFKQLGDKISRGVKCAILIGQTAKKIEECISPDSNLTIKHAESLEKAVIFAKNYSAPGDVVLLSPACASYDMFENFQQRGQRFIELVMNPSEEL